MGTMLGKQEIEPSPASPVAASSHATAGIQDADIVVTARRRARPSDPLIAANAKSFEATQAVDRSFVRPVAFAYKRNVPAPVRDGLRNFLYNLHEPDVFVNFLLQLKPGKAGKTLARFAINSTLGVGGLIDIAKHKGFGLPRRANGFADTFGYYGIKTGPFLYAPFIGPTTLRDIVGVGLDRFLLPFAVGAPFNQLSFTLPVGVIGTLDHRVEFDDQLHRLHDNAAGAYTASRDFYLAQRQAEIDALHGRPSTSMKLTPVTSLPVPASTPVASAEYQPSLRVVPRPVSESGSASTTCFTGQAEEPENARHSCAYFED